MERAVIHFVGAQRSLERAVPNFVGAQRSLERAVPNIVVVCWSKKMNPNKGGMSGRDLSFQKALGWVRVEVSSLVE